MNDFVNAFLHKYPYQTLHEMNLDWIISAMKELAAEMENFEATNKITYKGPWDITKQYPLWSIVTDNNFGYISTKIVPAGIDISNTEYWTNIADFSALWADVGARVTTLEGEMDTAQADITRLDGYRTFATRKVICISDSYGLTPALDTSWIAKLQQYLDIPNSNFYRSQENATGFIGLTSPTFLEQIQTLTASMSASEKSAITDIIIGGGMNDATAVKNGTCSMNDVYQAVQTCLTYAHSTFPNAMIKLFMPGWRLDSAWHTYLRGIVNVYQQASTAIPHVGFIDNVNWLHRQALLDATEYHPNAIGAYCIAKTIASVMEGGSSFCDLAIDSTYGDIIPTWTANTAKVTGLTITAPKQLYENGIATMRWQQIKFTINQQLTEGDGVKLLTFTDGIMSGGISLDGYSTAVSCFELGLGNILLYNNELWFTNATGSTIAANTEITVNYGSLTGSVMI